MHTSRIIDPFVSRATAVRNSFLTVGGVLSTAVGNVRIRGVWCRSTASATIACKGRKGREAASRGSCSYSLTQLGHDRLKLVGGHSQDTATTQSVWNALIWRSHLVAVPTLSTITGRLWSGLAIATIVVSIHDSGSRPVLSPVVPAGALSDAGLVSVITSVTIHVAGDHGVLACRHGQSLPMLCFVGSSTLFGRGY